MFSGGDGTQKTPYVISTVTQLLAFATSVNSGNVYAGKYVKLGADIDLKEVVWLPIGSYNKGGGTRSFNGFFDGAGFSIYNMGAGNRVRQASALFGALDGATINNVSLQLIDATGDSNVGGLVGFMSRSVLTGCSVSGAVKGQSAVGGIVGSAFKGILQNCIFFGTVVGDSGVGGIAGTIDQAALRLCNVAGQIEGGTDVGGFVGGVLEGMLMDCIANTVTVQGKLNVGGLVGNLIGNGNVNKSSFNGQIMGDSNVGGVVGRMMSGGLLTCSVTGSIKGKTHADGEIGRAHV